MIHDLQAKSSCCEMLKAAGTLQVHYRRQFVLHSLGGTCEPV